MHRLSFVATLAVILLVSAACSPTFNWREVRPDNTRLSVLLPCKPDKAQKTVPMGGQPVELRLMGCDAGDVTFAVAVADLSDVARIAPVLTQWQNATLTNMRSSGPAQPIAFKVPGASPQPAPVLVKAAGTQADGSAVSGQAVYFAQSSQVFQMVVYGKKIPAEAAETFFGSVRLE